MRATALISSTVKHIESQESIYLGIYITIGGLICICTLLAALRIIRRVNIRRNRISSRAPACPPAGKIFALVLLLHLRVSRPPCGVDRMSALHFELLAFRMGCQQIRRGRQVVISGMGGGICLTLIARNK